LINNLKEFFRVRGNKKLWIALASSYLLTFALIGCFQTVQIKNLHQEKSLSGQALYQTYCLRCHGLDGKGKGKVPLSQSKLTLDQFALKLQTGGNGMPAFKEALFDSDFLPLQQYTKNLNK